MLSSAVPSYHCVGSSRRHLKNAAVCLSSDISICDDDAIPSPLTDVCCCYATLPCVHVALKILVYRRLLSNQLVTFILHMCPLPGCYVNVGYVGVRLLVL